MCGCAVNFASAGNAVKQVVYGCARIACKGCTVLMLPSHCLQAEIAVMRCKAVEIGGSFFASVSGMYVDIIPLTPNYYSIQCSTVMLHASSCVDSCTRISGAALRLAAAALNSMLSLFVKQTLRSNSSPPDRWTWCLQDSNNTVLH